jgi:hypothetical protein
MIKKSSYITVNWKFVSSSSFLEVNVTFSFGFLIEKSVILAPMVVILPINQRASLFGQQAMKQDTLFIQRWQSDYGGRLCMCYA